MPLLRVVFPPPGWYLNDARCELHVDGTVLYDGGFRSGFAVECEVPQGLRHVRTFIHVAFFARTRDYDVQVPASDGIEVVLAYSRLWGNFASKLDVRPLARG